MRYAITLHVGYGAPADALERLFEQLPSRSEDTRFKLSSREIRVSLADDAPISMESDEREQRARATLLEILEQVCERSPELKLDWFAVSARRY